jgi:exodeoxyribonuclease III
LKKATKKKAMKKKTIRKTAKPVAKAPMKAAGDVMPPILRAREPGELRVASWNVNGIRSVFGKGLKVGIAASDLDVVMLQEVKATPIVLETDLENFPEKHGFKSVNWATAEKPGYSGLLTLCRREPEQVRLGLGETKFDSEGRWLEVDLGPYTFINSYFPNSQRESQRLPYKLEFCKAAQNRLQALEARGRIVVLAGDINVAHTEIDLANPKTNQKNAGFLPEERAWFSEFVRAGWVDVFREFEKSGGHYTWWSYRPGVREKNVGWRLDHFFISGKARTNAKWMHHQPQVRGSDHCPIIMAVTDV